MAQSGQFQLDRLKQQLQRTGLQNKDNALYQVIVQLIDAVRQFQLEVNGTIGTGGGGGGSGITNASYITENDETGSLPNSKQLVAGDFTELDDSNPPELAINGAEWGVLTDGNLDAGKEWEWSVLTDGDPIEAELIFTSDGDVIMTRVRVPAPGIIYGSGDVIMTHNP